jgi:hypothetical protein
MTESPPAGTAPMHGSRHRPLTAFGLGMASVTAAVLTAAVVLQFGGGGTSGAQIPGMPGPGPVTPLALPITRVLTDVAAARALDEMVGDLHVIGSALDLPPVSGLLPVAGLVAVLAEACRVVLSRAVVVMLLGLALALGDQILAGQITLWVAGSASVLIAVAALLTTLLARRTGTRANDQVSGVSAPPPATGVHALDHWSASTGSGFERLADAGCRPEAPALRAPDC